MVYRRVRQPGEDEAHAWRAVCYESSLHGSEGGGWKHDNHSLDVDHMRWPPTLWLRRLGTPSRRSQADTGVGERILRIFQTNRQVYGTPRILSALGAEGEHCRP